MPFLQRVHVFLELFLSSLGQLFHVVFECLLMSILCFGQSMMGLE